MSFAYRKVTRKPALTPKRERKKNRLLWAKEKQSWHVDGWMKVIFSVESMNPHWPRRFCCYSNETYKLPEENKFHRSFIGCCMSAKGLAEIAIITSTGLH